MNTKKVYLIAIILLMATIPLVSAHTIIDYYDEQTTGINIQDNHPSDVAGKYSALGESFTPTANYSIHQSIFLLSKLGTPTGDMVVYLYNADVSHEPTGAALAISEGIDVSTLTTSLANVTFTFNQSNQYNVTDKNEYCLVLQSPAVGTIDNTNYLKSRLVALPSTANFTTGQSVVYTQGSTWVASATWDTYFYIYSWEEAAPVNPASLDVTGDPDTFLIINMTLTEENFPSDLTTVTFQYNTTGDAQMVLLTWTQATDGYAETTDADNINVLNSGTSYNISNTQIRLSWNITVAGVATSGAVDGRIISTDDTSRSNTDTYSSFTSLPTSAWGAVAALIDSAFSFFGITTFIANMTAFVEGLSGLVIAPMTWTVDLIVTTYTVITGSVSFLITWYTRIINSLVSIFTIVTGILDGTYAITTGLGNVWELINFGEWGVAFMPIAIIIAWFDSMDKRGRTQGWMNVFFGDLGIIMNMTSFLLSMAFMVINTVVDWTMRFMDAIGVT